MTVKSSISSNRAGPSRRRFGAGLLGAVAGSAAAGLPNASAAPAVDLLGFDARYRLANSYIAEMAAAGIPLETYNIPADSADFTYAAWRAVRDRYEPLVKRDPELRDIVCYELARRRRAAVQPPSTPVDDPASRQALIELHYEHIKQLVRGA